MMMTKTKYIISAFILSISLYGQVYSTLTNEQRLIEYFKRNNWNGDSITKKSLYRSNFTAEKFNVSLNDKLIELDTNHIVIKNPYFSKKLDAYTDEKLYTKNFPKSFSVVYQSHLITLFENKKFVCIDLATLDRNIEFETKLNSRKFDIHWIIDEKLVAKSRGKTLFWDGKNWKKFNFESPFKNHPILFDDKDFIVYRDCHGEWGGTIYFYEKITSRIYFTESTCTNTVLRTENGYKVLAHLGHGGGSSEIKLIPDPRKLTVADPKSIGKTVNGQALGYSDKSLAFEKKLDLYGVQIFSMFISNGNEYFVVNLSDLTFLAKIEHNEIKIIHPLFFNDLYTHDPITRRYGEYTLINLDHYGTGLYREISTLIIHKNQVTKLDWNENHSR